LVMCKCCIMACKRSRSFCSCNSSWETTCIWTRAWAVERSSSVCSVFRWLYTQNYLFKFNPQHQFCIFLSYFILIIFYYYLQHNNKRNHFSYHLVPSNIF
jgi:hypothetical protein